MALRLRRRSRAASLARDESAPPIARADALAATGQFHDAIELLRDANRSARDAAVEQRLVEMRFEAAAAPDGQAGPESWPPPIPDLFANTSGLPEIDRDALGAQVLLSAILHHGALLVRGLIDPERARSFALDIDRAFDGNDKFDSGIAAACTKPWFVPLAAHTPEQREWVRRGGGVLAVESPRVFFDLLETFDRVGIRELVSEYFGEPPVMLANKWTLRRIEADAEADWHQDGSFMGTDIRALDLWLSLSDCGVDSPGLDVVARRFDGIVPTGIDGARMDWTVGQGTVDRIAEGRVLTPEFAAGDALFFDHLLLHRTGCHPGMTRPRHAVEAWFASPSRSPVQQLPIAY